MSHRGRASRALAAALGRPASRESRAPPSCRSCVALPPGAVAPPPGAVPRAAQITVLDRELGLVAVRLPRRGVAVSLRRLRAAPGVRYVERDVPVTLAAEPEALRRRRLRRPEAVSRLAQRDPPDAAVGGRDDRGHRRLGRRRRSPRAAAGTAAEAAPRAGPSGRRIRRGHGTAVASLLVANRPDVGAVGMVPDATLLSARILRPTSCSDAVLSQGLIAAFGWLRRQGAQVVNVSATAVPSRALIDSLRALQLSGALVVAAVGNAGSVAPRDLFPARSPACSAWERSRRAPRPRSGRNSTRGPQVDLVAPAEGIKVVASTPRASRRAPRPRSPRRAPRSPRRS